MSHPVLCPEFLSGCIVKSVIVVANDSIPMRQETDGPQAEQLETVPLRDRSKEELSPAQINDKETTYFSFSRSRRPS